MTDVKTGRDANRLRIVEVAARLLREQGPAAVTTRAVAQAAGLQTPVIYRLFADKEALLDAVAEHVFTAYVTEKAAKRTGGDPVAELRAAWETHLGFGLANPALIALWTDPVRTARMPAAAAGFEILRDRVRRIAAAGRLRVTERRAVDLIRAAGTGAVLTLLSTDDRDPGLAGAMFDAVLREILTDAPALATNGTTAAVVAFQTVVPDLKALSGRERALLKEWLARVLEDGEK
jgi:AcrR family transcriptional regulator